jgi:hypothetical protein
MKFREFQNLLKRLKFLDRDELERAGIIPKGDNNAWGEFRRNPYRIFIQAPDEIAIKIWGLIK